MRKKSNRGVTIAEAMVAMLIILVVSASAVTLITAYSKQSAAMLQRGEAITIAENTLECFKVADSYIEFVQYMPLATNISFEVAEHQTSMDQRKKDPSDLSSETISVLVSESGSLVFHAPGYTITVYVLFEEFRASYTATVISDNGEAILKIDNYIKAKRTAAS